MIILISSEEGKREREKEIAVEPRSASFYFSPLEK